MAKAPDPDGLSVEFYTKCWAIVKYDFVNLLKQIQEQFLLDTAMVRFFFFFLCMSPDETLEQVRNASR